MYLDLLPKEILENVFLYLEPEELDKYIKTDKCKLDSYFWKKMFEKLKVDENLDYNYQNYLLILSWNNIYMEDSLFSDCFSDVCFGLTRRKNWNLLLKLINSKPRGDKNIGQKTLYILLWEKQIEILLKLQKIDCFTFTIFEIFEALPEIQIKDKKVYFKSLDITCLIKIKQISFLEKLVMIYNDETLPGKITWTSYNIQQKIALLRSSFKSKYQTHLKYLLELDEKHYNGLHIDLFLQSFEIEEGKSVPNYI